MCYPFVLSANVVMPRLSFREVKWSFLSTSRVYSEVLFCVLYSHLFDVQECNCFFHIWGSVLTLCCIIKSIMLVHLRFVCNTVAVFSSLWVCVYIYNPCIEWCAISIIRNWKNGREKTYLHNCLHFVFAYEQIFLLNITDAMKSVVNVWLKHLVFS